MYCASNVYPFPSMNCSILSLNKNLIDCFLCPVNVGDVRLHAGSCRASANLSNSSSSSPPARVLWPMFSVNPTMIMKMMLHCWWILFRMWIVSHALRVWQADLISYQVSKVLACISSAWDCPWTESYNNIIFLSTFFFPLHYFHQ